MLRAALFLLALATPAAAQDRAVVAAVNYPLAWMAERLGGEAVEVLFPVPAGADPAFWRPSIAEIAAFQQADVIALNGADYAQWVARASLPRSRSVVTSAGFADALIETAAVTHSHGADGEHSHTGVASITWLDFAQAAEQAGALAAAMARAMPENTTEIAEAQAALAADLLALDARARTVAGAIAGTPLIASHPRYQYFARAYGLEIASVEWDAGAVPDTSDIATLAGLAEETGAGLFLWEAPVPAAAEVAVAATGLSQIVLPVLANRPEAGDFLSLMEGALTELESAAAGLN